MSYTFGGYDNQTGAFYAAKVGAIPSPAEYFAIRVPDTGDYVNLTTAGSSYADSALTSLTAAQWAADYVAQLTRLTTTDPTNTFLYSSGAQSFTELPAGDYVLVFLDGATVGSAVLNEIEVYYISETWQRGDRRTRALVNTVDTVVDAILVDTGTTLPAALTYDKDDVSPERTWSWPVNSGRVQSPQIVRVHPSFDGTLAFDLSNLLNEGSGISTVTSVTVSPSGPTVTGPNGGASPTKNSNNTKVLFDIDGGQSDSTDYTFTCTVTTTDSDDALVHTGLMQSRST